MRQAIRDLAKPVHGILLVYGLLLLAATAYRLYRTDAEMLRYEDYALCGFNLILVGILIVGATASSRREKLFPWPAELAGLLWLLGLLYVRWHWLTSVTLWLDEDYQFLTTLSDGPIQAGAWQHQPPNDLLFTFWSKAWGGNHEVWALRASPGLFSVFAGYIFYRLLYLISASIGISLLGAILFAFELLVARYGYEARPVSHGLFLTISFFFFLELEFLDESRAPEARRWLFAGAATLFLLMALGLQPPFLILGFVLFALVRFVVLKQRQDLHLAMLGTASVLLFLPIQILIFQNSPPRLSRLPQFSLGHFLEVAMDASSYETLYGLWGSFWWVILGTVSAGILLDQVIPTRHFRRRLSLFGVPLLVFVGLLIPFFKSYVDWSLMPHYVIFSVPLSLALLALALSSRGGRRFFFTVPALAFLFWNSNSLPLMTEAGLRHHDREELQGAYKFISSVAQPGDFVVSSCRENIVYCNNTLTASPYYLPANLSPPYREEAQARWARFLSGNPAPHRLFVLTFENHPYRPFTSKLSPDIPVQAWPFQYLTLLIIPVNEPVWDLIRRYSLEVAAPSDRRALRFLVALHDHPAEAAARWAEYEEQPASSRSPEFEDWVNGQVPYSLRIPDWRPYDALIYYKQLDWSGLLRTGNQY